MTPLALFLAATSEAGHPPASTLEYSPDHRAAFWVPGQWLPGVVARKALDLMEFVVAHGIDDDIGFHLGYPLYTDEVSIAFEVGVLAADSPTSFSPPGGGI